MDSEALCSYGFDNLRFIRPVIIGDTIWTKVTIKQKKDHQLRKDYGYVTEKIEVFNQHNQIVIKCDHLVIVKKIQSS